MSEKGAGCGPNLQTDLQGWLAEASSGCKIKAYPESYLTKPLGVSNL